MGAWGVVGAKGFVEQVRRAARGWVYLESRTDDLSVGNSILIFNQLCNVKISNGQHAGMVNAKNSILKRGIVFEVGDL